MKEFLLEIADELRYGIIKYKGISVLVRFYENEGKLIGVFWIPEKEVGKNVLFSPEVFRVVGTKDKKEKLVDLLLEHIQSLF